MGFTMSEIKSDLQTTALEYAISLSNYLDLDNESPEAILAIRANLTCRFYRAVYNGNKKTSAEIKKIISEIKS